MKQSYYLHVLLLLQTYLLVTPTHLPLLEIDWRIVMVPTKTHNWKFILLISNATYLLHQSFLTHFCRSTFQKHWTLSVHTEIASHTRSTRSLNTRSVRLPSMLRVRDVTTESNKVMVVRLSLFSKRRQRQLRRSFSSSNAMTASKLTNMLWRDASISISVKRRRLLSKCSKLLCANTTTLLLQPCFCAIFLSSVLRSNVISDRHWFYHANCQWHVGWCFHSTTVSIHNQQQLFLRLVMQYPDLYIWYEEKPECTHTKQQNTTITQQRQW